MKTVLAILLIALFIVSLSQSKPIDPLSNESKSSEETNNGVKVSNPVNGNSPSIEVPFQPSADFFSRFSNWFHQYFSRS
ncbi:hypothetical protein M3Y98_01220600 [Aphelenchoides besseyi]|nr:hypothetical protein M3Y98_01220600 [Aphelenchoides besseyi]KAI6193334.1 hypothetical protein M3Y96_01007100 [Aphelenchoides besseyi]